MNLTLVFLLFLPLVFTMEFGTILQLTDVHIDFDYTEGAYAHCLRDVTGLPCCHTGEVPLSFRLAGKFGDYNCDTPEILINETLKAIANMDLMPDMLLWTGDNPSHSDLTQSEARNLKSIKRVTDLIYEFLPKMMVYPSFGNHDTWPVDQLAAPPAYSWLREPVAKYWSRWISDSDTLRNGGFYAISVTEKLRIISINTLYYDSHNFLLNGNPDPASQYEWFIKELNLAKQSNISVWIIAHIYPGNEEATNDYSERYQKICNQYSDIITGQFFGHSHKDQFTLLRDGDAATEVIFIAPSVTPQSVMNPSYRIYYYDKQTYEIVDYDQYNMDLVEANKNKKVTFKLNYKASEFFKLDPASFNSGKSWDNIAQSFSSNNLLFQKWMSQVYNGNTPTSCNTACKIDQICHMRFATSTSFNTCVAAMSLASSEQTK